MAPTQLFRPLLNLALAVILTGCGNGGTEPATPADAYESFFVELNRGNRQDALEQIAPAGALGDTFRGGAYYTYADAVEAHLERHDGLAEVLVDDTGELSDDEDTVRVSGRLRFGDGTELERSITFVREDDAWVGEL